jgi:acyl dehydratase
MYGRRFNALLVYPAAVALLGGDRAWRRVHVRSLPAAPHRRTRGRDAGAGGLRRRPMVNIVSIEQLRDAVGREVALSDWLAVTQNIIDEFAEATRDAQWIHVDSERAARESPFRDSSGRRCTVAHGFLTLSLLTCLIESCLRITGASAGVNVGFDRVRFVAPVPAGSLLRGRFVLARLEDLRGGVQLTWHVTVERQGEVRPVLTAEWITRLLP